MGELEIFANRIKQLRKSLGMTQKDFSEYIGVKQQTLSGYERGIMKPPLDIAKNIAEKCDVSIDWLCGLSEKKSTNNEIKTYSDIIEILYKLEKTELGLVVLNIPSLKIPYFESVSSVPIITFNNMEMFQYLNDLADIIALKNNGTIKCDLYNLWIMQKMKELDKKIYYDGIPESMKRLPDEMIKFLTEHQTSPDEPPQE